MLFFTLFCLICINVFSQNIRTILFSEDEIEIINLILNDHIERNNETEILVLSQNFIWIPNNRGFNWLNIIENRFNANEVINDFLEKNSNNSENAFTIIDNLNIFNINNDIKFYFEKDFELEYENELIIERNIENELRELDYFDNENIFNELFLEYCNIRIIRTYFQVSRIGFNFEMDKALLWINYTKDIRFESRYSFSINAIGQYIFLIKEDGIWKIERPWFRLNE